MDGLAPSPHRSDRPMVSQDAGRGNDGRRRRPRGLGSLEPADDGNLSLGRRIGVLVVLAALGGAIVLAAGGVGGSHPVTPVATATPQATQGVDRTPRPTPSPPTGVPQIAVPDAALVTTRTITLRVTVPEPGTTLSGLVVHVYRNSRLLATQKVSKVGRLKVASVPLREGTNKLTATIANAGGEGPRSSIVTISLDSQAPKVTIKSPRGNAVLNATHVVVTGKTEGGLTVIGRNITSADRQPTTADTTGAYTVVLPLIPGRNTITVGSRDAAGNLGSASIVIVRGDGRLAAQLHLSRTKLRRQALPATIDADVTVLDAGGRPVEGAVVEFSIRPHGQESRIHTATTGSDGIASWSGIPLAKLGATLGFGLVAVNVTAPDGSTTTRAVQLEYKK